MKATLLYERDRHLVRAEGPAEVEQALAGGLRHFWLDLEAPGAEGVAWLGKTFAFHPLALEDLLQPNYRPKLAEFEGHLFLIAHSVAGAEGEGGVVPGELHSFLTRDYLVTVHDAPSEVVAKVQRTVAAQTAALERGPDYVLYLLLNEVVETYFDAADVVDDVIDRLEVDVLQSSDRHILDRLFDLRRGLATLRRLSTHLHDALYALAGYEGTYVRRGNALYLRDVQTLVVTVREMVDSQRDLTGGVLEVYLSTLSNRLNDVVKRLTIVATLFLPISFVAGVFGTNFTFMPFADPLWFVAFVVILIAAPLGMLVWFRRLGWL